MVYRSALHPALLE